jgi:quercetin dioxygenase-like cupin family protein
MSCYSGFLIIEFEYIFRSEPTMVASKAYEMLPELQAYKVDAGSSPVLTEGEGEAVQEIHNVMMTNDVQITYTTGEPGDEISWHSHMPELYQVLITTKGKCRWYYKDNDGETQHIDAGPGEVIYLPGGAENRVEVIGDEPHAHYGVLKRVRVPRVEHLVGDTGEAVYDHRDPPVGLSYDNIRDEVVKQDSDAVPE